MNRIEPIFEHVLSLCIVRNKVSVINPATICISEEPTSQVEAEEFFVGMMID